MTGEVELNRRNQLVAPADHDQGTNFQTQLDATDKLSDTLSLTNKAYFEDYSQLQLEYSQRYYNNIDESYNFEDRLELHGKYTDSQFITGVAYRFMHVVAYGDFFNEYLNATDLTTNPATYPITQLFGVLPGTGYGGQFATPGATYASELYPNAITNTQDQTSSQLGVFYQEIYNFTDKLSALGGARVDVIHESISDPLPPPGFAAAQASTTQVEEALDTSLSYKPVEWATFYGTVDFNQSPVTTNGGGFAGFTGATLNPKDFHVKNWLYEVGNKLALDDDTLYLTTAVFDQKRAQTDQFNNTTIIKALGAEFELNYQPNNNFSATAAASYLHAWLPDASGGLSFTENVYDAFAPPYGTGVGQSKLQRVAAGQLSPAGSAAATV